MRTVAELVKGSPVIPRPYITLSCHSAQFCVVPDALWFHFSRYRIIVRNQGRFPSIIVVRISFMSTTFIH